MFDVINYEGTVIRPPSEAESLIFQVTLGCTDNGCIFCPAYKDKKYKVKNIEIIKKEIEKASQYYLETRKIFLADGDAISIEQNTLLEIFDCLLKYFPKLTRISLYGSVKSLKNKSVSDLKELKKRKLGLVYLGFETGDEEVYKLICKYGSPQGNIDTCLKVKEAGIKTNVTVILGLGGRKLSEQHALNTAKILNAAQPDQIAALTLMIVENAPIYNMNKSGSFIQLTDFEFLHELYTIIKNMQDFRCLFFSNHASNYFPIQARFPHDKTGILKSLEEALRNKDKNTLKPEWQRGL
jgi:radical SAM superfamily enzyme YgiQ (UPF0313 family)